MEQQKKKRRKRKTTYKCPSLCNKLPLEIKRSENINSFKHNVKTLFNENGIYRLISLWMRVFSQVFLLNYPASQLVIFLQLFRYFNNTFLHRSSHISFFKRNCNENIALWLFLRYPSQKYIYIFFHFHRSKFLAGEINLPTYLYHSSSIVL